MNLAQFHNHVYGLNYWPHWDNNDQKFTDPNEWHREYTGIQTKIQNRMQNGKKLDKLGDKDLLEELILYDKNWIAIATRSRLSGTVFSHLMNDPNFLPALEEFMRTPDIIKFTKFAEAWYNVTGQIDNTPMRINRVAGACTDTVTSTAHVPKFKRVFNEIKRKGSLNFIGLPPQQVNANKYINDNHVLWFHQNQQFMKELETILAQKRITQKIDPISISMLTWAIFVDIKGRFKGSPLLLKI